MRKIMTVMLVALMMTLCSSCAQPAPEEEGKGILLEITMEEIVHANSTAALREAYDNFYIKYTYADGTKDARYVDDDLILMDFPDYDVAYTQDKCFYHAGGRYFGLFFAGVEQDLAWSDWLTVDEVGTLEETILEAYAENGKIYMKIKYITKTYNQNSNIKDDMEKYQLYIDNNLVSNG